MPINTNYTVHTGATRSASEDRDSPSPTRQPRTPSSSSSSQGPALSPQNAGRGAFLRSLPQGAQAVVRDTYDTSRQFHGSSAAGKASIRQNGFDVDRKAGGATETVAHQVGQRFVDDAGRHNYLTGSRNLAKSYAVTGRGTPPALVRTMADQQALGLHPDPDSHPMHQAVRTRQSIPAGYVLQSRQSGDPRLSGAANRHFQSQLGHQGMNVSEAQARQLLADVQSDSDEDDFRGVPRMGT